MRFDFVSAIPINEIDDNAVVVFTPTLTKPTDRTLKAVDQAVRGSLTAAVESEEFSGKSGQVATFTNPDGWKCKKIIVAGLGDKNDLVPESYRRAAGVLSRNSGVKHAASVCFHFGDSGKEPDFQAIAEGFLLGRFKLLDYKTGEAAVDKSKLKTLRFGLNRKPRLKTLLKGVERGQVLAEGQILARQLAQTPAKDLTPIIYARKAQQLARKYGFSCKVLDEKAITREKMGALIGVAVGSVEPPRFVIMEHKGGRAGSKPIVLLGKGVTFDSGGISLKPGLNMHEMKQDMAGSAAVLATLVTAARLKINQNIVGLIPMTENMPSGTATRPGDILTSRKGKTIEIINTDAEGRLILADGLDYANEFNPAAVIDIATLTGASLFILGYSGAPIMGNSDGLLKNIEDASKRTAERVWKLPIWDDHREQMKSSIADLVNSGGRPAGTIAAAAFLENFIGDWPWAHIDIAYVDLEPKGTAYTPKGASGFGVRLLVDMLSNWKKP